MWQAVTQAYYNAGNCPQVLNLGSGLQQNIHLLREGYTGSELLLEFFDEHVDRFDSAISRSQDWPQYRLIVEITNCQVIR